MDIQEQMKHCAGLTESLSQCQVCCMTFNESNHIARVLHCGHTFCMECIENVHKYGNSAHLECPCCRAETKCQLEDIPTNFLVMEMIRKLGVVGPAELAPQKEPKIARAARRERTIDEIMDERYRQLIADVKAELMAKFEELRECLRKSTIQSVQSELEDLSDSVLDAVRDAYDGFTDSEDGEENEDEEQDDEEEVTHSEVISMCTSFETARSDGETENGSTDSSVSVVEHQRTASSPLTSYVMTCPNPMRSSNDELSDETSDNDCDDEDSTSSEDESSEDDDESPGDVSSGEVSSGDIESSSYDDETRMEYSCEE